MTTPPDPQHDRPEPLRERSLSQINKLAIRIVPYTPPRLASVAGSSAEDGAPSPASSHYGHGHGHGHGRALCSPSSAAGGQDDERYALAGGWGAGVSATKLSPVGIPAGDNVGPGARTASVPLCPSEISDITDTNPDESVTPRPTSREHPGHDVQDGPASPTTDVSRPLSRRRISVALHSNKTFTLVGSGAASPGSLRSPPLSLSCSASSSHADRPSTGAWSTEDRPSSSLTVATFTSAAYPPFTPSPGASSLHLPVPDDSKAAVAWSHRMVGGLRRVPKSSLHAEPTTLAPLPEFLVYRDCEGEDDDDAASASKESPPPAHELVPKASFASAQTTSTTSETTNYRVYGHSSPVHLSSESLIAPSPGDANYEILDRSSPALPDVLSSPPGTSDSEQNFVVHGNPSAATSQVSVIRNPRPTCSQESLRVPALRTLKARSSSETFGYYRQRSRESLRQRSRESLRARTGELRSIKSFSSLISQEGRQTLFAAPALANLPTLVSRSSRDGRAGVSAARSRLWVGQHQLQQPAAQQRLTQASWSASDAAAEPSSAGSLLAQHPVAPQQSVPMIQAHPHQWSSQLSTVISESEGEGGSEPPLSRSVSALSGVAGGDNHWHRRRSSVGWASSLHSRQLPSLSSSLSGQVEEAASSSSPEPPQQTYERGGLAGTAGLRTVRDQDEHGDGLGDLRKLSPRPSRSGLSGFFSSSSSSSSNSSSNRNLHSSGSSKANSLTWGSIPAWARVYYGSGERPLFRAPSICTLSEGESRPSSSALNSSPSPNADPFPLSIQGQRRRPREVHPSPDHRHLSSQAAVEVVPVPLPGEEGMLRALRRKTSSIWSPHLRHDRRATAYSIWEPPSISWSADSGILGKRNLQVVLFAVGFIFPLAWMIAASLPLPLSPELQMLERGQNSSRSQLEYNTGFVQQVHDIDETRYASARWWRNLNRVMSFVGLLVIGAVIALAVVGVRQKWTIPHK